MLPFESDSKASLLLLRLLGKQRSKTNKGPCKYNGGWTINCTGRVLTDVKRGLICSEGSSISLIWPATRLLPTVLSSFFADEPGDSRVNRTGCASPNDTVRTRLYNYWQEFPPIRFDTRRLQPIKSNDVTTRAGASSVSCQTLMRSFCVKIFFKLSNPSAPEVYHTKQF